jgi:hypothetical protein
MVCQSEKWGVAKRQRKAKVEAEVKKKEDAHLSRPTPASPLSTLTLTSTLGG